MAFAWRGLFPFLFLAECVVVKDDKARASVDAAARMELQILKLQPGSQVHTNHSPVALPAADYTWYRFTASRASGAEDHVDLGDLILQDEKGQKIGLHDPNIVLQARLEGPGVMASRGRAEPCIDGNPETRCELQLGEGLVVRLAPGHLVRSYGFTTTDNSTQARADPSSFQLEGSRDGTAWRDLSSKRQVTVPEAAGLTVGPFMVAAASQGAEVPQVVTSTSWQPPKWMSEAEPRKAWAMSSAPAAPEAPEAPEPLEGDASEKVAQAVMEASRHAQLPVAEEAVVAAAASAAAADRASAATPQAIAQAVAASGLSGVLVDRARRRLGQVEPKFFRNILDVFNAAALTKQGDLHAPEKVAQVISTAASAGLSLEQQAEAAAQAAVAGLMALTTPGPSLVADALLAAEAAGLTLEKQTAMAAVLETQSTEEQEAVLGILRAAGISTTGPPSLDLEDADPAAKLVGQAVAKAVQYVPADPSEKLEVIRAAAEAAALAALQSSTTTAFDGVKLVLDSAEAAGIKDVEKLRKVQHEAQAMTVEQQKAAARSLEAAVGSTTTRAPEHALETVKKVSEVVQAAAASGMTEEQQASVAAAAVSAAGQGVTESAAPQQEPELMRVVKAAKHLGMSTEQQDALLSAAQSLNHDEIDSLLRTFNAAS